MTERILILNGPNLNMLGLREPDIYGDQTLVDLEEACRAHGAERGLQVECFQSNSEGELISQVQQARGAAKALILNAGGLSHTSVALRDAVVAAEVPMIEVHISNIYGREEFRRYSYLLAIATGVLSGFGPAGYLMALDFVSGSIAVDEKNHN